MSLNDLRRGRYSIQGQDYFVTFTTWKRQNLLVEPETANWVARAIHYNSKFEAIAWVVMPDHVHFLFTLQNGTLASAVSSVKAVSSRHISKSGQQFKWAYGYYDHALRKEESRIHIARYIVANPLRARLVDTLAQYPWWNAIYL